ncbi:MAG: hypothetical protein HQL10_14005 [Nitrospirae bacterium]|nr:hypothetical protein [Nitrospirota bacterium]
MESKKDDLRKDDVVVKGVVVENREQRSEKTGKIYLSCVVYTTAKWANQLKVTEVKGVQFPLMQFVALDCEHWHGIKDGKYRNDINFVKDLTASYVGNGDKKPEPVAAGKK